MNSPQIWAAAYEPEQFPTHSSCQFCLEPLPWDAPGPMCDDCRGGLAEFFGRGGYCPSWTREPSGRDTWATEVRGVGSRRGRERGGVERVGDEDKSVEREGWADNTNRALEDR